MKESALVTFGRRKEDETRSMDARSGLKTYIWVEWLGEGCKSSPLVKELFPDELVELRFELRPKFPMFKFN